MEMPHGVVHLLIAEIGQNHCGQMYLAKDLIRLAKQNGADLVKFQLYDHKKLYGDKPIPNVELSFDQAKMLFDYGREVGIEVFFSVFDVERVKWCEQIGVKRYKIAGTLTNRRTLKAILLTNKPVISSLILPRSQFNEYAGLWTINRYPTALCDLGLLTIPFGMGDHEYQGFSDHTIGLDAAKIALSRGAQIIEKHFCLNHETGIDAPWSMDADELRELKRFEAVVKEAL